MSVSHITCKLVQSSTLSINPAAIPSKDALRSLFLSLSPPISPSNVRDGIKYLQELEDENSTLSSAGYAPRAGGEEHVLKDAILGRLVAGIYTKALDTLLTEAIATETEAEWWADMERSWLRIAYHLIQSNLRHRRRCFRSNPAF
jgi:nuclear control of ATPase protein 2